ncbi:unnamed protein product [Clonostachys rosea f. rosea IK726]|uniref:ATP synthase mitochondrial F1 complex assembly factor 1 n=2 Tax=Bionectria ochroleuca TaxID=29856 RepID=A0A0B7K4J2_BIOOC|nr:unnamed protein product [Clonostachys rosea f. rosea IK726]
MSSLRTQALRHISRYAVRSTRTFNQRRWAQVHDVRFLASTWRAQSTIDKYREKLDQKAKNEGFSSIDELKTAYSKKIGEIHRKDAVEFPEAQVLQSAGAQTSTPAPAAAVPKTEAKPRQQPPPPASGSPEKKAVKGLDDIIDLEKAAPQFVLPVPHEGQGAEIHFLQWTFDAASRTSTVLFTQLAEFKNRGEFAQPHTTVTHHLDLADEKGLVLMQGQLMEDRGVTPEQVKWLVMCLQRFYGGWEGDSAELTGERRLRADERKRLLDWFASGDERFTVEKLLDEAERIG